MTDVNLKVNMCVVEPRFVGAEFATDVWFSRHAKRFLEKYGKKHREQTKKLIGKIEKWAESGFSAFEGPELPIRSESDSEGVFRIGYRDLLRLIGFYETEERVCFFVIDGYEKHGQSLNSADRARIKRVAKIKKQGLVKQSNE